MLFIDSHFCLFVDVQLGSLDVWMGRQIGRETVHWVRMG